MCLLRPLPTFPAVGDARLPCVPVWFFSWWGGLGCAVNVQVMLFVMPSFCFGVAPCWGLNLSVSRRGHMTYASLPPGTFGPMSFVSYLVTSMSPKWNVLQDGSPYFGLLSPSSAFGAKGGLKCPMQHGSLRTSCRCKGERVCF